ncbi:MAG: hypothetical protein V3U29_07720 [Phycisphaeraceae bacterium]
MLVATAHGRPPGDPAADATPIMPLQDVRIGMTGYGLSVFRGTQIEPFAVEVVSVMQDARPQRGVIWVRCPGQRMQQFGPVQGMSGSPIYLWPDDQPHQIGEGGLLVGAFAFGFPNAKDCYVGVQPIEPMREAGDRVNNDAAAARTSVGSGRLLRHLIRVMDRYQPPLSHTWRSRALAKLIRTEPNRRDAGDLGLAAGAMNSLTPPAAMTGSHPYRLMLPLSISNPQTVDVLTPLLMPMGLAPIAAPPGMVVGKPPPGIDLESIRLEPGSVLAIPLAFGDMDLSAAGTVTDVLPDGRVLAFGHAMFGQGEARVPMASGYVHFVQPSRGVSFKIGGSGVIRGAIVRDEQSGVVGTSEGAFSTAPVDVVVNAPDQPQRRYHYEAVRHRILTPVIVAVVVANSAIAEQQLPTENTTRLRASMTFAGGRDLKLDMLIPRADANSLVFALTFLIATMADNPIESMMLESMTVEIDVEPVTRSAMIVNATLDRAEVEPGDTLGLAVKLQPHGQPPRTVRIEMPIPETLPDGDYELVIGDAPTYINYLFMSRPHLTQPSTADELHTMVQRVLSVSSDAMYVLLQLPGENLAVGRQEFPQLPSSRRAMIATPATTAVTPYRDWEKQIVPLDVVPSGQLSFTLTVRKPFANR